MKAGQVPPPSSPAPARGDRRWRYTRLAAVLVLLPSAPMLLASIAGLALFYAAPARFESLLGRLPGEETIRTLLFFAPATLFAVVVLAFLYAIERPSPSRTPPAPAPRKPASTVALTAVVPLLLLSSAAWAARFIAPGRFGRLLDSLPGTAVLQRVVTLAPMVFFVVALVALFQILATRARREASAPKGAELDPSAWPALAARLARLGAGLVLLPTLPMLVLSLLGLGLYYFAPERLQSLVDRLSQPTVVRLGVLFTPLALLAVVLLAGLYLTALPGRPRGGEPPISEAAVSEGGSASLRQTVAVGILVAGLIATVVVGVGLLAAVTWLLIR